MASLVKDIFESSDAIVPDKPAKPPEKLPPTSQRKEMSAETIGFTLIADEETLRDIEEIQEGAIKAARAVKKFALR
ncbi:MAG: hypothetical protein WDN31_07170 [Hyphomicrobium sp.]